MTLSFRPLSNPLLLISDAPSEHTGLARVCRDVAALACTLPQFRVGVLGMGGQGRRAFPWASYSCDQNGHWGMDRIAEVWRDFSAGQDGIICTLWDLSRTLGFIHPQDPELARFLGSGRNFLKWGYVPVDSTGPDEQSLPAGMRAAAQGYDRLLAASEWGSLVVQRSGMPCEMMPHGVWMDKFAPHVAARELIGWQDDQIVIGCNMANQARKDFPVAFECAQILKADFGNRFKFWLHTDTPIRFWNVYALATDYGIADCLEITVDLTDDQLAQRYSACDCTILPSAGEGFGFPIAESMACGTPCVVTDYAAGQELVEEDCRVPPVAFRIDSAHNTRRAVLSGWGFASRAKAQVERKRADIVGTQEAMLARVEHLSWSNLKHPWCRWLREGLGSLSR